MAGDGGDGQLSNHSRRSSNRRPALRHYRCLAGSTLRSWVAAETRVVSSASKTTPKEKVLVGRPNEDAYSVGSVRLSWLRPFHRSFVAVTMNSTGLSLLLLPSLRTQHPIPSPMEAQRTVLFHIGFPFPVVRVPYQPELQ